MATDPFNIKTIPEQLEKIEIIYMGDDLPIFDIRDYQDDEEDVLLKDIESMVRGSIEYQRYVNYSRTYMNMNKCSFFSNISNIDTYSIKIHLHHSPITLLEIAMIVLAKRKFYRECLAIEAIAKEVMYVHYCALIGIIPLCETVHELVHNQYLFVPNNYVFGNYKWFIEMYGPWIPAQIKDKLDRIEDYTYFYDEAINKNILQTHYIYIDAGENGIGYSLPKMEEVAKLVEQKLITIKNNNYQTTPIQLVTMDRTKM